MAIGNRAGYILCCDNAATTRDVRDEHILPE
jgi:hypothetical protein